MTNTLTMTGESFPENVRTPRVHPQKFALWVGIACLIMTFAGLTSAYIVRKGAGNWVEFKIPDYFFMSAAIMFVSSITMHFAVRAFKRDELNLYRMALGATLLLSGAFIFSQYLGWQKLQEIGIYISGNPSGSFLYVISFLHVAHIAVGIILLLVAFIKSIFLFRNPANFLIYRTHSDKKVRVEMMATYWHFVDLLWLYLVIFFLVI